MPKTLSRSKCCREPEQPTFPGDHCRHHERDSGDGELQSNGPQPSRHPGALELVKVRKGTLVLEVDDEWVRLKTGHSAWFDASRQHAYKNRTTTAVTFTLVVFDSAARHMTEPA